MSPLWGFRLRQEILILQVSVESRNSEVSHGGEPLVQSDQQDNDPEERLMPSGGGSQRARQTGINTGSSQLLKPLLCDKPWVRDFIHCYLILQSALSSKYYSLHSINQRLKIKIVNNLSEITLPVVEQKIKTKPLTLNLFFILLCN